MTIESWTKAIATENELGELNAIYFANRDLLVALAPKWQDSVDVTKSMFDLMFTPNGIHPFLSVGQQFDRVEVRQRQSEDGSWGELLAVTLRRFIARASLDKPGGDVVVGGDVCRWANAVAVVESFLLQIAQPSGS